MTVSEGQLPTSKRLRSGVAGLDTILFGGFLQGSSYIVMGLPGAGKTILGNQICFHHVAHGGRALYVTLLAETHGRMLMHLQSLSFFDQSFVSHGLYYVSGYKALQEQGLRGLLDLIRRTIKEQQATLLVLDGVATINDIGPSDLDFKRFLLELQAYLESLGCTTLLLTSHVAEAALPEHTMVDGILYLSKRRADLRTTGELEVLKSRGSSCLKGAHFYRITSDGLVVYPRIEARLIQEMDLADVPIPHTFLDLPGLENILPDGLRVGSSTMLVGGSGSGKTSLALQFLDAGKRRNEPSLYFGFYETPADLQAKATRLGLDLGQQVDNGIVEILWRPAAEQLLDDLVEQMLQNVRQRNVQRLVIDGYDGLHTSAIYPDRMTAFLSIVTGALRKLGVTTIITFASRELVGPSVQIPITGVSEIVDNLLLLRHLEWQGQIRRFISILKLRQGNYDPMIRELLITNQGVTVGAPFPDVEGALTGLGFFLPYRGESSPRRRRVSRKRGRNP